MMADLAQLVRALVCGTRCREFESHNPPHNETPPFKEAFFVLKAKVLMGRIQICSFFEKSKSA